MSEDTTEVMATVRHGIKTRTEGRADGSLFPVATGFGLQTHGRIEDVKRVKIAEDVEAFEFRSEVDSREGLDVTNPGRFYDWLRENVGVSRTLPGFFRRNGALVRVPRIGELGWIEPSAGNDGPAQVRSLSSNSLIDIIQHRFWIYREKIETKADAEMPRGEKTIIYRTQTLVPREPVQYAIDGAAEWEDVPEIQGITHTQAVRRDGTLLELPGYDAASRVLYLPDTDRQPPMWSEGTRIQPGWVSYARDHLTYLLQNFPFETETHRLNAIALLLTPLLRNLIPPPYPMFLVMAHTRGTGKSLLAKVARELHGGVHRPELPSEDEEIRKQITSILLYTTAPIINFDNITTEIKSGQLANLLTTATWSDRPLGRTGNVEAANDRVWVATGNNIKIGGDMGRRVCKIMLDARVEDPEHRTDIVERDLVGYVRDNRGLLLQALLIQILWWVQNPRTPAEIRSDDYGPWASALCGILEGGGLDPTCAFAAGQREVGGETLSESERELGDFLLLVSDLFGLGHEFMVKDIKNRAESLAYFDQVKDALPAHCVAARDWWKSLGSYMASKDKTPAEGLRLAVIRAARGGKVYVLETVRKAS